MRKGNYKSHAAGQGEHTASLHLISSIPDSPGFATCEFRQASQKGVYGYIHLFSLLFLCFSRATGIWGSLKLKDRIKILKPKVLNFLPGEKMSKRTRRILKNPNQTKQKKNPKTHQKKDRKSVV